MTTEREQLELAAKACGFDFNPTVKHKQGLFVVSTDAKCQSAQALWNPLTDDGDCARMEAQLGIWVAWGKSGVTAARVGTPDITSSEYFSNHNSDKNAARRAASVAVAAEIGRMK